MSFKTLAQRYNEKVNDLYRGATSKFENGRPSRGANDDPIIVRRVGDGYFGGASRALGRFLPLTSSAQDVKRLTLFTFSTRGAVFLAKQALLQTGNTFESTRLLNPAFTVANAVPFLHVRRFLTPGALTSGLIGRTNTNTNSVQSMGQLQQGTYEKALGNPQTILGGILSAFTSKKNVGWPFPGANPPENFLRLNWATSRPELGTGAVETHIYTKQNRGSYVFKFGGRMESSLGAIYTNLFTYEDDFKYLRRDGYSDLPTSNENRTELLSSVAVSDSARVRADIIYDSQEELINAQQAIGQTSLNNLIEKSPTKFIRSIRKRPTPVESQEEVYSDDSNKRIPLREAASVRTNFPYDSLNNNFDDYIKVEIAMGASPPVKFRAFLKDLSQSINPQYKEYQYVGRTEKFISYTGAQREVSFKLGVLASTKDELKETWKRINYLTGLAFPYTVTRGIYQPNIVKITIGNVYTNQPVYITGISTNFSEIVESWDIENEVPMGAQLDMKCVLIEKRQQVSHSPFYNITENSFREEYAARKEINTEPKWIAPDVYSRGK